MEHDPARATSKESAIRQHAEKNKHEIHPRYGEILERNETNYKHRILLESIFLEIKLDVTWSHVKWQTAKIKLASSVFSSLGSCLLKASVD